MDKRVMWMGVFIGSSIGSFVPYLWGDHNLLSPWGIFFGAVGGIAGVIAVYKLYN